MKMVECFFFISNFCYILSNTSKIEKPDIRWRKFLTFAQFNNKKHLLQSRMLNFRVLMDCSNQENLKKVKEAILLNVYEYC